MEIEANALPSERSALWRSALWTVRQSAAFLGYTDGTVRNLMAKGSLPRVKLPTGSTRIPSEAVRAFGYGRTKTKKAD